MLLGIIAFMFFIEGLKVLVETDKAYEDMSMVQRSLGVFLIIMIVITLVERMVF